MATPRRTIIFTISANRSGHATAPGRCLQHHQTEADAEGDGFGSGGRAELGEDRGDVRFDGVVADREARSRYGGSTSRWRASRAPRVRGRSAARCAPYSADARAGVASASRADASSTTSPARTASSAASSSRASLWRASTAAAPARSAAKARSAWGSSTSRIVGSVKPAAIAASASRAPGASSSTTSATSRDVTSTPSPRVRSMRSRAGASASIATRVRSGGALVLRVARDRHDDRRAAAQHVERSREAQTLGVAREQNVADDQARPARRGRPARPRRSAAPRGRRAAEPARGAGRAVPARIAAPTKRCTSSAGTASASPPTTMLLIPTTRPRTSASGPPELPGASRRSAWTKRREPSVTAACAIPMVRAFGIPSGCPTATSTSPTRISRRVAHGRRRQPARVDAQQRQIARRVAAFDARRESCARR